MKQAKLRSFRIAPRYKYDIEVPKNFKDAQRLDKKNRNIKWVDSNTLKHEQLKECEVLRDQAMFVGCKIPQGYSLISVHKIFDIKVNRRHTRCVVVDEYLTATPLESVYSGVVSLRGLRICVFIDELDSMEPLATDVGNAYLEAITSDKVCIRARSEFGKLEGHLFIIYKALYGLRFSRKPFGQML